jgi:hypothetical protein
MAIDGVSFYRNYRADDRDRDRNPGDRIVSNDLASGEQKYRVVRVERETLRETIIPPESEGSNEFLTSAPRFPDAPTPRIRNS